jgi:hypothetical protein
MAIAYILILLLVVFPAPDAIAQKILSAVVTADNAFTLEAHPAGPAFPVPPSVTEKIDSLVDPVYAHWKNILDEAGVYERDYFYGPVFLVTTPRGLKLYIFRQKAPFDADFFFFMLFDPRTKSVTQNPPCIYAKWMHETDLQKPLLSFFDLDGDGEEEIVVQEQVHNGTMYNAIVYHYYHLTADLALRPILAVETHLLDLFTEEQGVINRTLEKLRSGQVRLDVFLDLNSNRRKIGEVVLRSPGPGSPFEIVQRKVFDDKYAALLITASEVGESTFLRDGYSFYY